MTSTVQTLLVGGAVRDRLLGVDAPDRDWVVVGSTPQEMIDQGYEPVGKDFPVFINKASGEEYALARTQCAPALDRVLWALWRDGSRIDQGTSETTCRRRTRAGKPPMPPW